VNLTGKRLSPGEPPRGNLSRYESTTDADGRARVDDRGILPAMHRVWGGWILRNGIDRAGQYRVDCRTSPGSHGHSRQV